MLLKVLMVGVDSAGKGGMLTVAENYMHDAVFRDRAGLKYIPTASAGSILRRVTVFVKGLWEIRKAIKSGGYNIVHMHLSERGSLFRKSIVHKMAKKAQCRTVIHMHGADFEVWYCARSEKKKRKIREFISSADRVLILGHYWEAFVGSLMKDPTRLEVLYNAVATRDQNPYTVEKRDIMFLGALIERKGIRDLLLAISKIRQRLPPECHLLLCGNDPDGIAARSIGQLGLEDITECLGWLDDKGKQNVMERSAVNVLPSYREGLPMSILETMAQGIPNIATRIAAIPEAVDDRLQGRLIEPGDTDALGDAILQILGNEELRLQYSAASWSRVGERFSLKDHLERLLCIYVDIMHA